MTYRKTTEDELALVLEEGTQVMAQKLGLTPKGIEWQIAQLKKEGRLYRIGSDKGGYWKVSEDKEGFQ